MWSCEETTEYGEGIFAAATMLLKTIEDSGVERTRAKLALKLALMILDEAPAVLGSKR